MIFDTTNLNEGQPLKDGEYTGVLVKVQLKDNKAGTGSFVLCEFKIVFPENVNEKVPVFCNVAHPNPKAVNMWLKKLKEIAEALKLPGKFSIEELNAKTGQVVNFRLESYTDKTGALRQDAKDFHSGDEKHAANLQKFNSSEPNSDIGF